MFYILLKNSHIIFIKYRIELVAKPDSSGHNNFVLVYSKILEVLIDTISILKFCQNFY